MADGKGTACPHLPPYGEAVEVQESVGPKYATVPEIVHHFTACCPCQVVREDGKPCDYKRMLICRYCPWTRPQQHSCAAAEVGHEGSVTRRWKNPVACRTPADVGRNGKLHVEAARNWHWFWHAVYHLEHIPRNGEPVPGDNVDERKIYLLECLAQNFGDLDKARAEFVKAGLLDPKFDQAAAVVAYFGQQLVALPKVAKRKPKRDRDADEASREGTPPFKSVKTEVRSPDSPPVEQYAPHHQSLPHPQAGGNGFAHLGAYSTASSVEEECFVNACLSEDPYAAGGLDDGSAASAGAAMLMAGAAGGGVARVEAAASAFPASLSSPHRPVFNLLLDAMNGVRISNEAQRMEWASYDPPVDFERGGEVELACVIGFYFHSRSLQSENIDAFFHTANAQAALNPLLGHVESLAEQPASAGVAASLAAIYCYWRIECELAAHPFTEAQLSRWQSADIRGRLMEILDTWRQPGAHDESQKSAIRLLLEQMTREINLRLRACGPYITWLREDTGSFAEMAWAPRIWSFFLLLRLRHDGDFSAA